MSRLTETATHVTNFAGRLKRLATPPYAPDDGDMYYDTNLNVIKRYDAATAEWYGFSLTTSTSTSISTSTTTT
jgi:hypothetical protein